MTTTVVSNTARTAAALSRRLVLVIAGAISLALTLAVAGCAAGVRGAPARPTVKPGEFGKADCFYRRQAEDFEVLDDSNFVLYAPGRRDAYHVHISPPSPELRSADALAFRSNNSQVCGHAGDRLFLDEAGGTGRYSITGVYRLDETARDALLARFGRKIQPGRTPPVQPPEQPPAKPDQDPDRKPT